jgi:Brp/Blh family beta-carotene 15,15'-monooxygenase
VWQRAPWLPFAVGLLAGLPHGAVDHLVPWWSAGRERDPVRLAGVLVAYLAAAIGVFAAARTWPVPAVVVLLVGSAVHFGTGETAVQDLRAGTPSSAFPRWIAYGAATVVLPVVAWPERVRRVLDVLAPGSPDVVLHPGVLVAATVVTGVAVLGTVVVDVRGRRWAAIGELGLLVALFLVVPPLPAFGVYFGAWHGLRHLMRLVAADPANTSDLRAGCLARPVRRLAVHAAPPTLAVLAALGALVLAPGWFPHVVDGLVSAGLSVVLALTVPHMAVVAVLDRRQLGPRGQRARGYRHTGRAGPARSGGR